MVRLNDAVVAQIGLKANAPLTVADIDLPVELLHGGSNRLTFMAAQHYTNDCENPNAAELWSQIDTNRSRLTIAGRTVDVAPRLSELQDLIGPGFFGGKRFTLLTPDLAASEPTGEPDDGAISTGAILSQSLGLRLRYQAPQIGYAVATSAPGDDPMLRLAALSDATNDPGDLVLFGTKDKLGPVLGPVLAKAIKGGFIGLYALPSDHRRLVLLVSGITEEDVARAASAFGVANFPFVDAPQQGVDRLDVQPGATFLSRNELQEGTPTQFSQFGFRTTHVAGTDRVSGIRRDRSGRLVPAGQRASRSFARLRVWRRPTSQLRD